MFEERIAEMNGDLLVTAPQYEKRVYTVDEIQDILGVGKNTAYDLIKTGQFKTVKVGGHYRVSKKSFDDWLDKTEKTDP